MFYGTGFEIADDVEIAAKIGLAVDPGYGVSEYFGCEALTDVPVVPRRWPAAS